MTGPQADSRNPSSTMMSLVKLKNCHHQHGTLGHEQDMTQGLQLVSPPLLLMADPMNESEFEILSYMVLQCMKMAQRCCLSGTHDTIGFQEGWVQGLPWLQEGCMNLGKSLNLSDSTFFRYMTHIKGWYRALLILTLSMLQ